MSRTLAIVLDEIYPFDSNIIINEHDTIKMAQVRGNMKGVIKIIVSEVKGT